MMYFGLLPSNLSCLTDPTAVLQSILYAGLRTVVYLPEGRGDVARWLAGEIAINNNASEYLPAIGLPI